MRFPAQFDRKHRDAASTARWIVLACLVLLLFFAAVQIGHVHPTDANPSHCALCMAQQTTLPLLIASVGVVLVALEDRIALFEPVILRRISSSRFTIRPPPRSR